MRNNRGNRPRVPVIQSMCGDMIIRKTQPEIVKTYEGMAYQAERDKDPVSAQTFFQHAEHYKK